MWKSIFFPLTFESPAAKERMQKSEEKLTKVSDLVEASQRQLSESRSQSYGCFYVFFFKCVNVLKIPWWQSSFILVLNGLGWLSLSNFFYSIPFSWSHPSWCGGIWKMMTYWTYCIMIWYCPWCLRVVVIFSRPDAWLSCWKPFKTLYRLSPFSFQSKDQLSQLHDGHTQHAVTQLGWNIFKSFLFPSTKTWKSIVSLNGLVVERLMWGWQLMWTISCNRSRVAQQRSGMISGRFMQLGIGRDDSSRTCFVQGGLYMLIIAHPCMLIFQFCWCLKQFKHFDSSGHKIFQTPHAACRNFPRADCWGSTWIWHQRSPEWDW